MKELTAFGLVYGLLFLINVAWGSTITIFLQSLIGAVLFIALAIYVNKLDEELKKEVDELKKEIEKISSEQHASKFL